MTQRLTTCSTPWCGDGRRLSKQLDRESVSASVDLEREADGVQYVKHVDHGDKAAATAVFSDGTALGFHDVLARLAV